MKVCYDGTRGEYYESSDSLLNVTSKWKQIRSNISSLQYFGLYFK